MALHAHDLYLLCTFLFMNMYWKKVHFFFLHSSIKHNECSSETHLHTNIKTCLEFIFMLHWAKKNICYGVVYVMVVKYSNLTVMS